MTRKNSRKQSGAVRAVQADKKMTQSTLFSSRMFNRDHEGKAELVELEEDSEVEIVEEKYHVAAAASITEVMQQRSVKTELVLDANAETVPSAEPEAQIENATPVPKDEPDVACPICGLDLDKLTLSDRNVHVDDCFNFTAFGEPDQTDFKVVTDSGYVYKSMKAQAVSSVDILKRPSDVDDLEACSQKQEVAKPEKRPKRAKNPIPELKIMDFRNAENEIVTKISMDAFCYKEHEEIQHYFLSHFHSDHYMGITKSWNHGQIYCSLITKKLLVTKFKVDENIITHLEFETPTKVPDTEVQVTLIDANHCPGSAIFLFENLVDGRKILHCGDFRINKQMIASPHLFQTEIDSCYLDTTYLNPVYAFPKQEHVISVVSDFCDRLVKGDYSGRKIQKRVTDFFDNTLLHKNKKNYLICIGTYTIGKERIAIDIARKLGVKLYANVTKREILATFDWDLLDDLITDDPFETQVHLIPMTYLSNDSLDSYFKPYKNHFQNIIAFRPTGWSFISNGSIKWMSGLTKEQLLLQICRDTQNDQKFNLEKIEKQFKSDKVIQIYGVPYSEHSSFRELSFFCILLNFKRIIPTVNVHNLESIREMQEWIDEWRSVKDAKVLDIDLF